MSKQKFFNSTHIEGRIYDHKLKMFVSGEKAKTPGVEFIAGSLSVATDEECMNVVTINFHYVTAMTKKNTVNPTFNTLKAIIDHSMKTVVADGKDCASLVSVDSAIGLNEFVNRDGELIIAMCNDGGFVRTTTHLNDNVNARATFKGDMLITKATFKEADEERQTPDQLVLHGAMFNFAKALLPVDVVVTNPNAISYFESKNISSQNPLFTVVEGIQESATILREITKESAFGEPIVTTAKRTRKQFVVTWAAPEPYAWDDEATLTKAELQEMMAQREVHLAEVKNRAAETASSNTSAPSSAAPASEYKF